MPYSATKTYVNGILQVGLLVVICSVSLRWVPKGQDSDYEWLRGLGLQRFELPDVGYQPPAIPDVSSLCDSMEEISSQSSAAMGQMPMWLKGSLLRNGPGLMDFGEDRVKSLADGLPMIRKYQVESQMMNMSRRLLESQTLRANLHADKITKLAMKTVPESWTMKDRILGLLLDHMADIQNVHTIKLFGHFYATTETPRVIEYDPKTLDTIQTVDLSKTIPGLLTMTPHPQYDEDGTMWNVGITPLGSSYGQFQYVVFKVTPPRTPQERDNPWLNLKVVTFVNSPRSGSIPYFHSFFMTKNYLILPEHPWVTCDVNKIVSEYLFKGRGIINQMYWDNETMLEFRVIDKAQGVALPIRYIADPGVMYHPINTHEEAGYLILDAPFAKRIGTTTGYDFLDMSSITVEGTQKLLSQSAPAVPLRYALPLTVPGPRAQVKKSRKTELKRYNSVTETRAWMVAPSTVYMHPEYLAPPEDLIPKHRQFEFGAINPNNIGKKYRFTYGLGFPNSFFGGIILKIDVEKKAVVGRWEDSTCLATEPIFIPSPQSNQDSTEEDGVLIFVCHKTGQNTQQTSLVVLSSQLKELGRFSAPVATTIGIHGIWLPNANQITTDFPLAINETLR